MSSTANGFTILGATVTLPRSGPWHADLVVATDDPSKITGAVALSLVDDALLLQGTTWRDAGAWRDVVRARVVGGRAGLRTALEAGSYRQSTVRTVLLDILGAAGERVSPTVSEALLDSEVDDWVRLASSASSAGAALQSLANDLGVPWRVLPDGTVWLGEETWPEAPVFDYVILDRRIESAEMTLGVEKPVLLAGTIFEGARVGRVVHRLGADRIRTDVYFDA